MHEHLRALLLEALCACSQPAPPEGEESPRLDPCADENEYASRVAEVGVALCLRQRQRDRRRLIEDALRRLDLGGYGLCEECGEDIGPARLAANPEAALCVHCQCDLERGPVLRCA